MKKNKMALKIVAANIKSFARKTVKQMPKLLAIGAFLMWLSFCIGRNDSPATMRAKAAISIIMLALSWYTGILSNVDTSTEMPVPKKRFTRKQADDTWDFEEITVDKSRLQEMIVYMYDLENYLEKVGKHEKGKRSEK